MRVTSNIALAIMLSAPSLAMAQFGGYPSAQEQQLDAGFLGEQLGRMSSQDMPPSDDVSARAAAAIGKKDFAGALAILRPHRTTPNVGYKYLAGMANEGLGDYPAARKAYASAIGVRKNFTAAEVALAILEAEHGDRQVAVTTLTTLGARRTACADKCKSLAELVSGMALIEAALKKR